MSQKLNIHLDVLFTAINTSVNKYWWVRWADHEIKRCTSGLLSDLTGRFLPNVLVECKCHRVEEYAHILWGMLPHPPDHCPLLLRTHYISVCLHELCSADLESIFSSNPSVWTENRVTCFTLKGLRAPRLSEVVWQTQINNHNKLWIDLSNKYCLCPSKLNMLLETQYWVGPTMPTRQANHVLIHLLRTPE